MTTSIRLTPKASPMRGESKMKTPILRKPSPSSDAQPAFATAAPAIPPTKACEDDVGRPAHQVMRSHPMAPIRPAKTTDCDSTFCVTTPLAIVDATFVPNTRNAMKLKNAAHATARRGDKTRVETTVAIE